VDDGEWMNVGSIGARLLFVIGGIYHLARKYILSSGVLEVIGPY
jgi:hypothetical protein